MMRRDDVMIDDEERVPPDVVLPTQLRRQGIRCGAHALLAGMLTDAIRCLRDRSPSPVARRLRAEAEEWMFGSASREHPFAFEHVCEHLSLDPDAVRGAMRASVASDVVPPSSLVRRAA